MADALLTDALLADALFQVPCTHTISTNNSHSYAFKRPAKNFPPSRHNFLCQEKNYFRSLMTTVTLVYQLRFYSFLDKLQGNLKETKDKIDLLLHDVHHGN